MFEGEEEERGEKEMGEGKGQEKKRGWRKEMIRLLQKHEHE